MRTYPKWALAGGATLLALWTAWGLYSGRSAEEVSFERVGDLDGVELRRYPRTVLVETTAPDQYRAFGRLFRYISGENESSEEVSMTAPVATRGGESIAMTAPVRSSRDDGTGGDLRMSFYLPAEYDPETAPVPTDPAVRLVVEPAKTLAVKRFSWYAPSWRVERQSRALVSALADHGIEVRDEPFLLRYNDPMTPPFLRRNEVAVRVGDDR